MSKTWLWQTQTLTTGWTNLSVFAEGCMCVYVRWGCLLIVPRRIPLSGTISSPQPWLSSVTCQMRKQNQLWPRFTLPQFLRCDKEQVSLAVCEIKTTLLSWKCGQYLDKRTAATRSTFQQLFLTFRPHRVTFHMCDVLGVDSKAQHSHRQLIYGWNVEYAVEPQEEDCFCTATSCYRLSGWVIIFIMFHAGFSFNWFLFGSVWVMIKGLKTVSTHTLSSVVKCK